MPLEEQKRWIMIFVISLLTKVTRLMPVIKEPSVSIKTNLVRGDFGSPVNTVRLWWIFKLTQVYECYDAANKLEIEQRWVIPPTQSREIGRKKYYEETRQENLKNGSGRFHLNIDVRKEKEDSWLNVIKTKIAFVKGLFSMQEYNSTQCSPYEISSR